MNDIFALAGLICVLLALHSIVFYPLSLLAVPAKKTLPLDSAATDATEPASLAICVSAYNEEKTIEAKVERLLEVARDYGPATVHVYVDAPTDGTAALVAKYADRADIVFGQERRGKTFGMNLLVQRSESELLLFTDANVESSVDVATRLAGPMRDPLIGCTTAKLVYSNRKETATASLGAIYWAVEEAIKRLESRSVGLIGCDGAMFMMRRSLHVAPPPHLIDDLYLSLSILIAGSRIVSVDDVEVYERSATRASEEGRRKQRIACQAWNVHRALWPRLRALPTIPLYAYISHRPMKWLMPFFAAGAVTFFTLAVALSYGILAGLAIVAGLATSYAAGAILAMPPFSLFHSAVRSLLGVALGAYESFVLHRTYTIWNPATSVRSEVSEDADLDEPWRNRN